jgi:hypothetical protein
MQQFGRGLAVLTRLRNKAQSKTLENLKLPPNNRGILGVSKGFGDFECGDEVLDAVYKLEDYYQSM